MRGHLRQLVKRLLAVGRLGRDRHVVECLEVGADAAAHHRVVVDDHHLDLPHRAPPAVAGASGIPPVSGTASRTRVPQFRPGPTVILPPHRSARSRMVVSP